MVDGNIKIGVTLDAENLEKGLTKLEYELEKRKDLLNEKARLELDITRLDDDATKAGQIMEKLQKKFAGLSLWQQNSPIGKDLLKEISKAETENQKLVSEIEKQEKSLAKVEDQLKRNLVVITETKNKQEENAKATNKISETMGKLGKTAKLWVSAIFGVRTAYNAIRQAVSLVASQNEEIQQKIDAMKNGLANLLSYAVEPLINGLFKMMQYLDYIVKAWFGISMFSKANDRSLKGAVGSAKALRKELMGFDEANVLQDDGGTSGVGSTGTGDFAMPDVEIPKWVQWISDNKEKILSTLKEIAIYIGIVFGVAKIFEFIRGIQAVGTAMSSLGTIFGVTGGTMAAIISGIIVIIGTLIYMIFELIDVSKKKKESNESLKISEDNLANAIDAVNKAEKSLSDARLESISAIKEKEGAEKALEEAQRKTKISAKELMEQVEEGILTYENMTEEQRDVYEKQLKLDAANERVKISTEKEAKALETATSVKKKEALETEKLRIKQLMLDGQYEEAGKAIGKLKDEYGISWKHMKQIVADSTDGISKDGKKTFEENIPESIKKGLEPSKFSQVMSSLGTAFKNLFSGINKNAKIEATVSGKSSTGSVVGVATGGVIKMASGGIINLPNQGVPLASGVIGGEAGAEGVIPLTNSQMMSELGQAIGRWITLDFTNVTELNGKVISREIAKIQNEDDFVMNR